MRFSVKCTWVNTKNGKKAIPVQALGGSRRLRLPEGGGKVISPTNRSPLPPRKYTLFLLEAESTPGP